MNKTILLFLIHCIGITAYAQQNNEEAAFKADTVRDDSGEIISIIHTKAEKKESSQVPKNVGFKVESEEETIEVSDIDEKTVQDSIPIRKVKAVRQGTPLNKVTTVPDKKGDLIVVDTIFDRFNRISSIKFNKVNYDEAVVSGQLRIIKKETPYIREYTYHDDIFKILGNFHITMGILGFSLGVQQLVMGIVFKSPVTSSFSSIPIILGGVEIGIGVRCKKHRMKFWKFFKNKPIKITKKVPIK